MLPIPLAKFEEPEPEPAEPEPEPAVGLVVLGRPAYGCAASVRVLGCAAALPPAAGTGWIAMAAAHGPNEVARIWTPVLVLFSILRWFSKNL